MFVYFSIRLQIRTLYSGAVVPRLEGSTVHLVAYIHTPLIQHLFFIPIYIIKNEVGCRDDTVPKTVDTRRHCEEE